MTTTALDTLPIRAGDAFERVAPCLGRYPQPGDRYFIRDPWDTTVGLTALGRVKSKWHTTELVESLRNPTLWKRIDVHTLPSMLDVLSEELATLRSEG